MQAPWWLFQSLQPCLRPAQLILWAIFHDVKTSDFYNPFPLLWFPKLGLMLGYGSLYLLSSAAGGSPLMTIGLDTDL